MRSLVCNRPGALAVEDRPTQARERARSWFESVAPASAAPIFIFLKVPPVPRISAGHRARIVGQVADTGPGCAIPIGQQVYIIPYLACGVCVACRRGKTNCCQRIRVLGVHVDGGMADYVCVPEANVARADGVTLDQAAMVKFLAIGPHAVRRANPLPADRILVVGAGPIGIGCMLFAGLQGGFGERARPPPGPPRLLLQTAWRPSRVAAGPNVTEVLSELTGGTSSISSSTRPETPNR